MFLPISLQSERLSKAGFVHGFSTRAVDLALGAEGYGAAVARFAEAAGFDPTKLRQTNQVHGADVVLASSIVPMIPLPPADALVSEGELVIGVRVADCVPVLVGDRQSGAVAAIHAGWKGFVAGVVASALGVLRARGRVLGSERERTGTTGELVAAIGPCIGPCCFEVGLDVAQVIERAAGVSVIARTSGDKAFVDLRLGVRAVLEREGVKPLDIEDVPGCTRCDETRFFSFRRGGERGRMLGAIVPTTGVRAPNP